MAEQQEQENTEVVDTTAAADNAAPAETPAETPAPAEAAAAAPADDKSDDAGKDKPAGDAKDGDDDADPAATPEHKPQVKFKAGVYNKETRELEQKEFEIDKRFHPLMKDAESEKLVRELHEKAFGLDSVKERYVEEKTKNQNLFKENTDIKSGISGLRKIYQGAIASGNMHKLDPFFQKLNIPQDVLTEYVLAKVQLNEMDPAQKQAIQAQITAEQRAEALAEQQEQFQQQTFTQAQQMKALMLDSALARAEVSALASEFDNRFGRPGAFREEVAKFGEYEWLKSQGKVDLSPDQAIKKVIEHYALTSAPRVPAATSAAAAPAAPGTRQIVQRTTKTLPNVAGRSSSPLAQKPRSIEDIKKITQELYGS